MKLDFKKLIPDALCVVLFAVIAFVYFSPAVLDGRRLEQHDSNANDGINVEINQYRDTHGGETPRWNTSLFGGMPTYQIAPSYDSTKTMTFVEKAYHMWMPDYVWYIFASMLGFYILLRAFDFKQWMAALGAIVWAFSSYFFIIIAAGHIWKVMTLAYIPPTIAGLVLCYKKKYLLGGILTAVFAALQIQANHVQMTYYFLIPEILMVIAFLIEAIMKKELVAFGKATASVAVAAVIAVCLNISNLYHTYEYAKDTMRGKSELVKANKTEDQTDSGLERSYITAWSYGIDETFTFLIPNYRGGASEVLSRNETAMSKADAQLRNYNIYNMFTQYWGEQPMTSGPVYLGAIVCMLFVLGLILIPNKNPLKWAMIVASILTLMLGWGRNFMPFTDFFIDYVPMYAKFRTVSSILVVVEFTVPFLALWGLKLFVEKPNLKALYIATGITVGLCLILMLTAGDCLSMNDKNSIASAVSSGSIDQQLGQNILASISSMREAMLTADAWRSIFFIVLGAACMWIFAKKVEKKVAMGADASSLLTLHSSLSVALLVLCLIDMWQVNKRYLNDDMFVMPRGVARIQKTPADEYILEKSGTGRDYRVMNLTVSTFNDNTTSAFYSSIGGYHAAKLRRYQELIEARISGEMGKVYEALRKAPIDTVRMMQEQSPYPAYDFAAINTDSLFPVLNMLNTRWFILAAGEGQKVPIENVTANGNAWFVTDVKYVNNANEELDVLGRINPKHTAVVAQADFGFLKAGGEGSVKLTSYGAVEAKYEVDSKNGGLVVFSEVYYPGWTATVDGQTVEVGRANYVLRAINVPAGKHEVVMTFQPESVSTTETIAYASLVALVLAIAAAVFMAYKKKDA